MKLISLFKVSVFLLASLAGFAWGQTDLMLAKISGLSVPVLVAKDHDQMAAQALKSYQDGINKTSMSELWARSSVSFSPMQTAVENPTFLGAKKYVLIVANRPGDMTAGSARTENVARLWREHGFEPVLLALGAGASLTAQQRENFHSKISEGFEAMISLGGDDVDPKLYGEKKTFSKYTHPFRDLLEYQLVKNFKSRARGLFVGICRGHQMGAVVDGHTLYQDLAQEKVAIDNHHEAGKHPLVMDAELQKLMGIHRSSVTVNSIHHQSVKINPGAASKAVAFSDDGIVEALEMKNGLGISFQFHPELMAAIENTTLLDRYLGNKFFAGVAKKMKEIRTARPLCRRAHTF